MIVLTKQNYYYLFYFISFCCRNILECSYNEISALLIDNGVAWVGTRNGFIILLDTSAIEEGKQEMAIRAMQYCGDGRVKSITSLKTSESSTLKVQCTLTLYGEMRIIDYLLGGEKS